MALPGTPAARMSAAVACLCVLMPPTAAVTTPPGVAKDPLPGCNDGNCTDPICPLGSVPKVNNGHVTCFCDLENCTRPTCNGREPQLLHKATGRPGDCCDLFECPDVESTNYQCEWKDELKRNGTSWSVDDCTVCRCEDGIVVCTEKEVCPDIPVSCPEKHTPRGKCCPVCLDMPGCVVHSKDMVMQNGEKWQEDPCTTCICNDGKKECWSFTCEITCSNPKSRENECCPVCEDGEAAQTLHQCPSLNCSTYCPSGLKRDDTGCPVCKCQQSKEEETEAPPAQNKGIVVGDEQDDIDAGDNEEGEENGDVDDDDDDETVDDDDDLLYPVEEVSGNMCRTISGDLYEDGRTWFDGCRHCYCHDGSEMCNLIKCPIVKCAHPVFNPSRDCCPHCQDNAVEFSQHQTTAGCLFVDGLFHMEGEIWSLNRCTKCLCHSGQVMCKAEECPPTPCLNPVYKNDCCCPLCPNVTFAATEHVEPCVAHDRKHGEAWREHNCSSCICNSGKTECFIEKCPEIQCEMPVLVKNQCCSICLGNRISDTCTIGNRTYKSGEKWDAEECDKCECRNGIKFCFRQTCSEKCGNILTIPECCSTCEGHSTGRSPAEEPLFDERTYSIIIGLLFFLVAIMGFYLMWQCYRRKQYKLGNLKSCSSTAYNNYMHRDSFAPPRYSTDDRQSKCEPCHYKYVPPYDTTQFSDFVKSPSFGATEKTALAPM